MISFTWFPYKEDLKVLLAKYETNSSFQSKFAAACYYSLRWVEDSYVVGTMVSDARFFPIMVDWIHKQSDNNIQIEVIREEEVSKSSETNHLSSSSYLFSMKVSEAYKEPLTRYITYYLALVTLRMSDFSERFTHKIEVPNKFTYSTLHQLIVATKTLNTNHSLYYIYNENGNYYDNKFATMPEEVLSELFDVDFFNHIFNKPFIEYSGSPSSKPSDINIDSKVSQSACVMKMCRELHLLEGLDDGTKEKKILKDFNKVFIPGAYRAVELDLEDPLYTSVEEKIKLAKKKENIK